MKNIVIIGATSAIAQACAQVWARQGHHLMLVGRSEGKLNAVKADAQTRGAASVTTLVQDLADVNAGQSILEACQAQWAQIDYVLVAHGTLPDQAKCQDDVNYAIQEFNTNGLSVIALLTTLAKQLETQRHGTLGVISSVAGDRGRGSNYLYGAAKSAVSEYCSGLRARLSKLNVHVLTIKPGFVATPMTAGLPLPEKLTATPEAVAADIIKGFEKKRNVLYTPFFWWPIMMIIKMIPEFIFKKLSI